MFVNKQTKFQHPTTFVWQDIAFQIYAYHAILTGTSDIKLSVDGVYNKEIDDIW